MEIIDVSKKFYKNSKGDIILLNNATSISEAIKNIISIGMYSIPFDDNGDVNTNDQFLKNMDHQDATEFIDNLYDAILDLDGVTDADITFKYKSTHKEIAINVQFDNTKENVTFNYELV